MKRNAAIYARVSSDRQREQNTIASQTALLLDYAKAHDLVVPQEWIFQDDGYSGSVLARPGLERLRDLVAEGFIETLLVMRRIGSAANTPTKSCCSKNSAVVEQRRFF